VSAHRPVKDMWWEGDDLHVVYADDDTKTVYKGATMTKLQDEALYGEGIVEVKAVKIERGPA
jgi:hypothetical protein